MSISPQPQTSPFEPVDSERDADTDQTTATGGAEVMAWPKQQPKVATGNLKADLLAKRQAIVLRVLASFSGETTLQGGLIATSDALKMCFSADRVAIGLHNGTDAFTLAAISQQADIDSQTAEAEQICAAMREAMESDQVIVANSQTVGEQGLEAHRFLCSGRLDCQIVTVPICHQGQCIASLCFERNSQVPFAPSSVGLMHQNAEMLAPLIDARRQAERGMFKHLKDTATDSFDFFVAPRYIKRKVIGALFLISLVFAFFWQTTHWIKASAELVPLERRVISAPIEGYVKSVETGSGDQVNAGDVLLRIDTSDAAVERARWQSELAGLSAKMRSAMAVADRREMAILSADIDTAKAQLELVDAQLKRSIITAPVDGVVVSGDLSQMVGAPVSRGQLLLELAPEKGYEVHLLVDGDKINRVHVGDPAALKMQAWSAEPLELVVDRIHPIGIAQDGANRFRVVGTTLGDVALLMPGQTGIGKINVGKASLLKILTGDFIGWLKLKKWEWIG